MNKAGCFSLDGKIFTYLKDFYNNSDNNERTIEVPVALYLYNIAQKDKGRIMEVGAVLPHYHPSWRDTTEDEAQPKSEYPHFVIDQFEIGKGIFNQDIKTWIPKIERKYELILSISTMEHIFDREDPISNVAKWRLWEDTVMKLRRWLSSKGCMLITLPYGQPREVGGGDWIDILLDGLHDPNILKRFELGYMESKPDLILKMNRLGFGDAGNSWHEVDPMNSASLPYNISIPSAGTIFFLFWGNVDRFLR